MQNNQMQVVVEQNQNAEQAVEQAAEQKVVEFRLADFVRPMLVEALDKGQIKMTGKILGQYKARKLADRLESVYFRLLTFWDNQTEENEAAAKAETVKLYAQLGQYHDQNQINPWEWQTVNRCIRYEAGADARKEGLGVSLTKFTAFKAAFWTALWVQVDNGDTYIEAVLQSQLTKAQKKAEKMEADEKKEAQHRATAQKKAAEKAAKAAKKQAEMSLEDKKALILALLKDTGMSLNEIQNQE